MGVMRKKKTFVCMKSNGLFSSRILLYSAITSFLLLKLSFIVDGNFLMLLFNKILKWQSYLLPPF